MIQSNSITSLDFCIYFLFNALWRLSPIGINLQGPILCWLQHGEILKQKSWPKNELTKNPNSTFVSDSGFFVSKRSTFLLKNYQPWVRMHRIGPCKFIPMFSYAIIIKWRTVTFVCNRKVIVKVLIFRCFYTLLVSQRLRSGDLA